MEETTLTPRTVTELKQVTPDEISELSVQVMEADKVMKQSTEELEDLSSSLYSLAETKERYDEVSKKVKGQMRNLVTKL